MPEPILDPRIKQLRVWIEKADRTQDYWELTHAWVTVNGSWDDVPQEFKKFQKDTLGGDHHCFGMAINKDGSVAPGAGFYLTWPDQAQEDIKMRTPHADGWASDELWASFNWRETPGPYVWQKFGNADKLHGLGMPWPPLPWETSDASVMGGVHVTFFGVWQERTATADNGDDDDDGDDDNGGPTPADIEGWLAAIYGLLDEIAEHFGVRTASYLLDDQ